MLTEVPLPKMNPKLSGVKIPPSGWRMNQKLLGVSEERPLKSGHEMYIIRPDLRSPTRFMGLAAIMLH